MALMSSLLALAIDSMLPAFSSIKNEFAVSRNEDLQWIIAILFLGYGLGQLVFGPLSDILGRKTPIYIGLALFILGSILSGVSQSFPWFLCGRFLQGFGGASPRIVSLALIRDEHEGESMAQITSLVMTVFILVPALAPSLGQVILWWGSWRHIFISLFLMASLTWVWLALRQPETLPKERRKSWSLKALYHGVSFTLTQKTTLACIIVSGLLFGIFVGYLGAVQILFAQKFQLTDEFPLLFGLLALCIGAATFFNARWVMMWGIHRLLKRALSALVILGVLFLILLWLLPSEFPIIWVFMPYMMGSFFCVGFLFGNLNALGMKPLGEHAGIGSATLGFLQSLISVVLGVYVGGAFQTKLWAIPGAFASISFLSLIIFRLIASEQKYSLARPKK